MMTTHSSAMAYFDTMCVGDEPAETLEQRLTRCYQLAGYALSLGTAPDDAQLVHGTMHAQLPGTERIEHAWLELPNETVWEPVSRRLWLSDTWEVFARPIVQRRYTQHQVRLAVLQWHHWGPWEDGNDSDSENNK